MEPPSTAQFDPMTLGMVGDASSSTARAISAGSIILPVSMPSSFNEQYLRALTEAKVGTAPPLVALHRVTELVIEIKFSHRLVVNGAHAGHSFLSDEVQARSLFTRLHETGAITAANPSWCLRVYLAILDEVHQLPAGAPELGDGDDGDDVTARTALQVTTVLGALGGR